MKTAEMHPLIAQKQFPAISIILPTHQKYPDYKLDEKHVKEILNRVEQKLRKNYSESKTTLMMGRLEEAIGSINFSALPKGLAIYISPDVSKVIKLPYTVSSEKVIVSDTFEVRDLVAAIKRDRPYLLVMISQNKVKTFYGFRDELSQVEFADMPLNVKDVMNEHSFPGLDYLDTEAWKEKNLHNFIHFIDEVIDKELRSKTNGTSPAVIVMGDTKLLSYLNKMSVNPDRIAGMIEGNYEHATISDLKNKVKPILEMLDKKDEKKALDMLAGSLNTDHYAAGIENVWRTVAEKKCRLLLVEKDYRPSARHGEDEYTIILDDEIDNVRNSIPDAVDDIIEMTFNNGGDVFFVENGKLERYQRIACVTFY